MKIFYLLLGLSISSIALAQIPQTIAYWRFEEGTNGWKNDKYQQNWFYDSSGNGNYLQTYNADTSPLYTNNIPFGRVPINGNENNLSLKFTPNNDLYAAGVGICSYNFYSGWTVEAMVKFFNTNAYQVIVGKDGQPRASYAEDSYYPTFSIKNLQYNNKLILDFIDGNTNHHYIESSIIISPDIWYYIAAVCDGNCAELYIKRPGEEYELQGRVEGITGGALFNNNSAWTIGRGQWNSYNTDWASAYIDEVRISAGAVNITNFIGYDEVYDSKTWSVMRIVNSNLANARIVSCNSFGKINILIAAGGSEQTLYFYRQNDNGDFVQHNIGNPYNPNNGDKSFAMQVGNDDKLRIAICGPGGSPDKDHVLLGTETAPGASTFAWEEVIATNHWANQMGFCLDENNCAYIVLKNQATGKCAIFDNTLGSWQVNYISTIDPNYPRAVIAVDYNNNPWVIFNGRHNDNNYIELWTKIGNNWEFSEYLTNALSGDYEGCYFLQSIAGMDFKKNNEIVFVMKPDWWSSDLEIWQGELIPEPKFIVFYFLTIIFYKVFRKKMLKLSF